jgi:hypothetical protein
MGMSADDLTRRLDTVFGHVNGWLRFAEAKNAALLTLNAAAIFGLNKMYVDHQAEAPDWLCWVLAATTVQLILSLLFCLVSFFARTKVPQFLVARASNSADLNLMFYGHIAQMTASDYVEALGQSIGADSSATKHQRDVAGQIVINSKITLKKYSLFNIALWLTLSAIITPIGALLFYWGLCNETI